MGRAMVGRGLLAGAGLALWGAAVRAQDGITGLAVVGAPVDRGLGFQPPGSSQAVDQQWFDNFVHYTVAAITVFVILLMLYVILRFNKRAHPVPRKFTHNTPLEVTWTLVPVVILIVIGSISLPLLFKQLRIPKADVTIKITGHQWYWSYEYIEAGFGFDSYLIGHPVTLDADLDKDATAYFFDDAMVKRLERAGYSRDLWLLAVDNAMVVPVGKTVVVRVTATDVIHAWKIPAFAVMTDAVPGRIAEQWFVADREGIYFGQCSELCGKDHAYMPIAVKVVSEAAYAEWLARAAQQFAGAPAPDITLAAAD